MDNLPSLPDSATASTSQSRKRARSSVSNTSSSKRAMSEDPSISLVPSESMDNGDVHAQRPLGSNDIDEHMTDQTKTNGLSSLGQGQDPSSSTTPTNSKERHDLIKSLKSSKMRKGEVWYIIARSWWTRWEKACLGIQDKSGEILESQVGPVDNSSLVDSAGNLTDTSLIETVDVEFLPEPAWRYFESW